MEREIRSVFSKFVPPEIINDLVARKGSSSTLAGEKRRVAVLFSDIRGFTTLSEENPPEAVVSFLNRYLEAMCEIIYEQGGMPDKFIGDAILAVFGATSSWPDNALRAVRSARAMIQAVGSLDTSGLVLPSGGLRIGIGIHSGDAIVGNIGSSTKIEFTVIGDTVNLASRLEGLTKYYHRPILASQEVLEEVRATEDRPGALPFRELEEVIVKGKGTPTLIHLVEEDEGSALSPENADLYKKALSMYRMKNWKLAEDFFARILETQPTDEISTMFRERCAAFLRDAPPEDWDLIQRYLSK
jgi:class 3 adenylate cyclase